MIYGVKQGLEFFNIGAASAVSTVIVICILLMATAFIVVLKPGSEADADSILSFARARIGGFKVPKSVDFVPALPKNATGKVLKRELRLQFVVALLHLFQPVDHVLPPGSRVWGGILRLDELTGN